MVVVVRGVCIINRLSLRTCLIAGLGFWNRRALSVQKNDIGILCECEDCMSTTTSA